VCQGVFLEELVYMDMFQLSEVNGNTVAGKYTPTEADRAGLMLFCRDTNHANWKGENTEQTVTVVPQCKQHQYFSRYTCCLKFLVHM